MIDGSIDDDLTRGEHDEEAEVARTRTFPGGDEQQVGLEAVVVFGEPVQRVGGVLPYRIVQHLY